jgi:hypothetical protein
MEFLKITATDGTMQYIPDNYVVQIKVGADVFDAGSVNRAPMIKRGKITEVKYTDGTTITTEVVAAFNGTNKEYEYGCLTVDGAFQTSLSNYTL